MKPTLASTKPVPRAPFDRGPARADLHTLIVKNLGFRLGPTLRRIASASVAAALIGGCSMSHVDLDDGGARDAGQDDGGPLGSDASRPDAWVPPPSSELCLDGTWLAVHGLDATESPAYLAALHTGFDRGLPWIIDEIGVACGDASDVAACTSELERVRTETWDRALLTTDGDVVRARISMAEIEAFVGPVNTPNEAALVAWKAGYEIWCSGDFLSSVTEITGGYRVIAYTANGGCASPWITTRYTLDVSTAGAITVIEELVVASTDEGGCIGRRPVGLRSAELDPTAPAAGAYFANVARLEASAVAAFDIMMRELTELGAPAVLLDAARAAREDEVRHAETMGELARTFGVEPIAPAIDPAPRRSRFEIALENAVEGCVRETFGALLGAHQSMRASDPRVASAMRTVADDEIRHAELSWAVASWLEPQLTGEERARILSAKREAVAELRKNAAHIEDPELADLVGLPDPRIALAMIDELVSDVWA